MNKMILQYFLSKVVKFNNILKEIGNIVLEFYRKEIVLDWKNFLQENVEKKTIVVLIFVL